MMVREGHDLVMLASGMFVVSAALLVALFVDAFDSLGSGLADSIGCDTQYGSCGNRNQGLDPGLPIAAGATHLVGAALLAAGITKIVRGGQPISGAPAAPKAIPQWLPLPRAVAADRNHVQVVLEVAW
jgi:hypothetical protein